jgi:L-serine/L-threonine ammonia-lyase
LAAQSGTRAFVSSSGGNAGAAVAYAGSMLGLPVTVVVPESTPSFMRNRLKEAGATVHVHGSVWDESDKFARELATKPNTKYVSPFDDPDIWQGHSTLIQEICEQMEDFSSLRPTVASKPSAIVLSVGGGGLLLGACVGMDQVGWNDVPIIAAETEGAASFAATQRAGSLVKIDAITSIAKSLGASTVAAGCVEWMQKRTITSVIVSDKEAMEACYRIGVENRCLVEPACGTAIAAALKASQNDCVNANDKQGPLVIVVCGGNISSPKLLHMQMQQVSAEAYGQTHDVV